MKLFEIDHAIRRAEATLEEWAAEHAGDLTDCPSLASLIDMEDERESKLLDLGCFVKELDAEAAAIGNEALKLMDRSKSVGRRADRIRAFLTSNLRPEEKLHDFRCQFSWRKAAAVIMAEGVVAEDLPEDLQRWSCSIDKMQIKDRLKAGEVFPFATLKQVNHLQIK